MPRTRVKFCGFVDRDDVIAAVDLGVDAIGLIFGPSPRRLTIERAVELAAVVPPLVTIVGVFVDPSDEEFAHVRAALPMMLPQFSGSEPPDRCEALAPGGYLKAIHVGEHDDAAAIAERAAAYRRGVPLFDTALAGRAGGSGRTFDHALLPRPLPRSVVAGGLTPTNVGACVSAFHPYAVDVRSGIERDGRKDLPSMRAFLDAVRGAEE